MIFRVLLLVLLAFSAPAQMGVQQPMFSSPLGQTTPYPQTIAMLYWNYEDLSDGAVSSWTDRIQNVILTQTTGAAQPSKNTNGVFFSGNAILTNTTVVYWNSGAGNAITIWYLLSRTNHAGGNREVVIQKYNLADAYDANHFNNTFWLAQLGQTLIQGYTETTAHTNDYAFIDKVTGSSTGYTNSVKVNDVATTSFGTGLCVGNRGYGGAPLNGSIFELAIITNAQPYSVISNLHNYATNKYKYGP